MHEKGFNKIYEGIWLFNWEYKGCIYSNKLHNVIKQFAIVLWALKIWPWDAQTMRKKIHIQIELPTSHGYIPKVRNCFIMLCFEAVRLCI